MSIPRKETREKISEFINKVYNLNYTDWPEVYTTNPSKSIRHQAEGLRKTTNYPNWGNVRNIVYRIPRFLFDVQKLDEIGRTDLSSKYKKELETLLPAKNEVIIKYNIKQYNAYVSIEPEAMSLEAIIEENEKDNYRCFIATGDIIAILSKSIIPSRIRDEIIDKLPLHPWDAYPEARKLSRHFIIHAGGTNTGKTYQSLERLKKASSGAYLSPLRLLAMEVQDNLNASGTPCSLLTGEEEDRVDGSNHISSTVEMADFRRYYEVVVIDECQMIEDTQRGGFWTEAIMGMNSPEIHLCMAPSAIDICKKIITDCGDTYEIIEHERFVPLEYQQIDPKHFNFKKDIQPGDALVVFSRKSVLQLAADLNRCGINASVVYGALPYESRKKQVELFSNKTNTVVVATDAIGMGLNLPIHRVIFMEVEKYDGERVRPLKMEEIKQIAGRAGRRGMYTEGYVSTMGNSKYFARAIKEPHRSLYNCFINFPESLIDVNGKLEDVMTVWAEIQDRSDGMECYMKQDVKRTIKLIKKINYKKLSKQEIYNLCTIPFDDEDPFFIERWSLYIKEYYNGAATLPKPEYPRYPDLKELEKYYKELGLYFGFSKKMKMEYDQEWLKIMNSKVCTDINKQLIETKKEVNTCAKCGKPLPWDFKFKYCEKCYASFHNSWEDYW